MRQAADGATGIGAQATRIACRIGGARFSSLRLRAGRTPSHNIIDS